MGHNQMICGYIWVYPKKGYTPKHGCLDLGNMMINDEILVAHSNLVMDYSFDITVSGNLLHCY